MKKNTLYNSRTCNNAVFIIVTDEPLEELELAPPFVMMLCIEWIVVSTINIYINILVLKHNTFKVLELDYHKSSILLKGFLA